jgi:phenylpropionate dioxygenase-like ring-hydroxylating dioxygenase large terminal subunit
MNSILACDRPESGGREAEAATERAREVRRLAVAHKTRHVGHRDRRLLDEQCRRGAHAPLEQVLVKALAAELGIRALHLARRARQRSGHRRQRQMAAVVARHHHP